MSYTVSFTSYATRRFRKIPREYQLRLKPVIDALAYDPRPHGVEIISGTTNLYRVRVGDYRILYEIQDNVLLVLVVDLGHCREIYRKRAGF